MENGFYYHVHGFKLHSEIECPELLPTSVGTPDILVRLGSLVHIPQHETHPHQGYCIEGMHMLLNIKDVGRFSVKAGREIIVDPVPDAETKMIRLFLLGTALGCILHQRGLLPLHANAFLHKGEAVLVLAHSGTGKSTLAAAMKNKGCTILSDDVCAIQVESGKMPEIYPGIPQIKLWKDAAAHLGEDTSAMLRVIQNEEKYVLPVREPYRGHSAPIKALYVLDIHNQASPQITELTQIEKIDALRKHTYRKGMVSKLGITSANLKACANLAQSVRMQMISRPKNGFLLDELTDLLEADLQ